MTAVLAPDTKFKAFDNNGLPLAFGQLFTYAAGTTTPQASYVDSTQTTQNTNPINLNFRGECDLWLSPNLTYKFLLKDVFGNQIPGWPIDNIPGGPLTVLTADLLPSPTNTVNLGGGLNTFKNLYLGPNAASAFDPVSGNIGYYARTPAEIAAPVTPVNFAYAPLTPSRYNTLAQWSAVYNVTSAIADTYWPFYRADHALHPSLTNCLIGYQGYNDSLLTGTIGYRCTALGVGTLRLNSQSTVAGGSNTAVGYACLQNNIEGSGNTGVGALVLNALSGVVGVDANHHNTAGGYRALSALTSGVQNSVWGFQGGNLLQTGNNNSIFGDSALSNAVTLSGCCVFGQNALFSKTAGDDTVAIGMNAGFSETTAVGSIYIGFQAGFQCVAQGGNTIIGHQPCGNSAEPGANNVVIGFNAGQAMNRNAGVGNAELCVIAGYQAGLRLTGGSQNVILGQQAGNFATSGSEHVILGPNAGQGITTAIRNVSIGSTSGVNLNGNNNTSVGYNAGSQASAQTFTNCGSLGANAVPTGSNQITLGDSGIATLRCQVTTITALSDERFKTDIRPLDISVEAFADLNPVVFRWIEGVGETGDVMGFIAQELDRWQIKWGLEWMELVSKANPDRWEATPMKLFFPLLKHVQSMESRLQRLERLMQ